MKQSFTKQPRGTLIVKSLLMGLFVSLIYQASCVKVAPTAPRIHVDFDTTFSIAQATFRNDTSISRSVLSPGKNNRLWKFIEKANVGGTVRIGFIGGSITAGARASDPSHDYASLFCKYTGQMFPKASIVQINAGIGATNSRFGTSRIQDDLLQSAPDLVVVEFGVNDDPSDSFTTMASMEGIVRQCLHNPDLPVIMLFLMNRTGDSTDQHWHSLVGRHYGLPLVSYRDECWPLVESGALPEDSLFADAIHPNNQGHQLLAFLLSSFLANTISTNRPDPVLPFAAPLVTTLYEHAFVMKSTDSLQSVSATGGWTESIGGGNRVSFKSLTGGNALSLASRARELTIGYQLSVNTNSRIMVSVDGVLTDTLSNIWVNGTQGGIMQLWRLYLDSIPAAHTVLFTSADNDTFNINYILGAP
jgi:lysophospholipase L1-like esterase